MLGGTQAAWIKYGAVIALIILLSLLICYANGSKAMRKAVEDDTAAAEPEEEPVNFLTAVKCLFGNKYWVIVLLFNLITAVSSAIAASSGAYWVCWGTQLPAQCAALCRPILQRTSAPIW